MAFPSPKLKQEAKPRLRAYSAQAPEAGKSAGIFAGMLILLYALEFLGVHDKIPLLKVLHFNVLLSLLLGAAVLAAGGFRNVLKQRLAVLLLIFIFFTLVGISYSVVKMKTFGAFKSHMGYFVLFACIAHYLDTEKRLRLFLLAALAVHCLIIFLNIGQLTSGVRAGNIDAAYFLGDGNDFAWSLAMMLPFALYFILRPGIFSRVGGLAASVPLLFGLVTTMSRGAFIAVGGSFLYFTLRSRRKFAAVIAIALIAGIAILLAPQVFWDRMDPSGYMQGSSTAGRLQAWKAATRMAIDYPLGVGAGNFQSVYGRFYVDQFSDSIDWAARRWISPHSIYFAVLAEYGFLGLILILAVIGEMILVNWEVMKKPESGNLPVCISMSIMAFALGGLFLGGIKYPHLYILGGLTLACRNLYGEKAS